MNNSSSSSLHLTSGHFEARGPGRTVSYLPIHPPHWARLPTEPDLYTPLPELRIPPPNTVFPLDTSSTCADDDRTNFDPRRPTSTKSCKLYTLLSVYAVGVEVQLCPRCPHERRRYIGPDLRTSGVFNYNNSILVSHELLDEYTSEFTSSETPFAAFVLRVSRRYKREGARFMGEDLFRSVWFSYVYLQRLTDDMTCGSCGPSPTTVIFDGITLGYGNKHVKDSLRPPTTISEHSLERKDLRYYRQQQLLPDALLRRRVRAALEGPDFAPLLEDLEGRLQRMSTSTSEFSLDKEATPAGKQTSPLSTTSSGLLSTPSITRSFALFAMQSAQSPTTSPATPSKQPDLASVPTPIVQPNFTPALSAVTVRPAAEDSLISRVSPDDPFTMSPPGIVAAKRPVEPLSSVASPSGRASPTKRALSEHEANARKRLLVREHLAVVDWVQTELTKQGGPECPELAALFDKYFGQLAYAGKARQPKHILSVWKNLFTQVSLQSVLRDIVNVFTSDRCRGVRLTAGKLQVLGAVSRLSRRPGIRKQI